MVEARETISKTLLSRFATAVTVVTVVTVVIVVTVVTVVTLNFFEQNFHKIGPWAALV